MRLTKTLITLILVALIAATAVSWHFYQRFISESLSVDESGYVFNVKRGSSLLTISNDIQQAGLSDLPKHMLYLYGRFYNKAHLVKAGEYNIQPNTTLPQLLDQLVAGRVIQHSFTIVEGMSISDLLDTIQSDQRILNTLQDTDIKTVMSAIGQPENHGEGEFLPETYYFSAGTTDIDLLKRAHKMMSDFLRYAWSERADNLPYKTPYEALIMASIIEKETGIAEERAQISGVFVRRLQKGMRLQTDPTVIYGMGESYNGNIRRKDLTTDTPYNTYTRHGLPPTPIALASKESIIAALHPQSGKSLYFVATGSEGRHVFSNSLKAHNKAVRKYQLKK